MRYGIDGGQSLASFAVIRPQNDLPDVDALLEMRCGPMDVTAGEEDVGD